MTPLTIAALSVGVVAGVVYDNRERPETTVAGTVVERTEVDVTPNLIRIDCSTNPIVEVWDSSIGNRSTPIDVCTDRFGSSSTTLPR